MPEIIIEILQFILPSLVVLAAAHILLSQTLGNYMKVQQMEMNWKNRQQSMPVRMQAYERLVLYLERINPRRLLPRVRQEDMTAPELHLALINSIRMEFEHNITQQLYVSSESWMLIRAVTEELISVINRVASTMPTDAGGLQLSRAILEYLIANEGGSPTEAALERLKQDARKMFV